MTLMNFFRHSISSMMNSHTSVIYGHVFSSEAREGIDQMYPELKCISCVNMQDILYDTGLDSLSLLTYKFKVKIWWPQVHEWHITMVKKSKWLLRVNQIENGLSAGIQSTLEDRHGRRTNEGRWSFVPRHNNSHSRFSTSQVNRAMTQLEVVTTKVRTRR